MDIEKKVIRFHHGGRVEITQSQCRITQAWVTLDTPDVVVVGIDCNAKYCEIGSMSAGEATIMVNKQTLNVGDHPEEYTKVTFKGKRGDWELLVDGGRYDFAFAFVRKRKPKRSVYFSDLPVKADVK